MTSHVDWKEVDKRLPCAQVPQEKAKRDALFHEMDSSSNGFITISEAQNGLPHLLEGHFRKAHEAASYIVPVADLKPAVKLAFGVARKVAPPDGKGRKVKQTHDLCVDRREFHALLVAFRAYIELLLIFQDIDTDGSLGRLNWKECEKCLPLLEQWNISEKDAKHKFPDDWTPSMTFSAFADWCIMRRFGKLELLLDENDAEETIKYEAGSSMFAMLQAFQEWDVDGSGTISAEELAGVLMTLDSSFTNEDAMKLFAAADVNKDGFIDYSEFMQWIAK
uniref:EF-hand domain-containing protein n=1 Tax=Alexandrium catenella TaxID=2925 RepID=A0A7S1L934_ALECA|eukprot:CAMPEP_0171197084 /NCGR_PEP_ID=MMETSP0790-20130122/22232_1 /TAXON_ID=2925 /ORGANISM="Alexandrium catenella, Strain OF101" /LENGTH=277 /DNA_ID=CAMNT_0011662321 /DNA_START=11 /DNA_END=844 /DNA_ORIENTATION=-